MQAFINGVFQFVYDIYNGIMETIRDIAGSDNYTQYTGFLYDQIFKGDLINISLTWKQLLLFIPVWVIIILFIIFIFKLVSGVFRFFFIGK